MSNIGYNVLILGFCWVMATAAGVYTTFYQQPDELERVKKAEQVVQMKEAELTALLAEETESEALAAEAVGKWNARYRSIPKKLSSPEVVAYLNDLTPAGFENFDVSYDRTTQLADYSYHTYKITGRGYFSSLYKFVWDMENSRSFYRLRDLNMDHIDLIKRERESGKERMQVMVSFTMTVEAYFGGIEGLSADGAPIELADGGLLSAGPPVEIPENVLPTKRPSINPFFPVILEQLPPNSDDLVEIDKATLVSVVGDRAIFQYGDEYRSLGTGDEIYLGHILEIDPATGKVKARLNLGGIIDHVDLQVDAAEHFSQAKGPQRLAPID